MGEIFSASEIVEIGVRIEENGRAFYSRIAETVESESVREVFTYLAKEEEKHIKVFKDLLYGFESYEPEISYTDEYFNYLKALSRQYIFTQDRAKAKGLNNIKSSLDAIDIGIGFEKDSILFYHEIKNMVWMEGREIIDKVIEEERKHFKRLWELKDKMLQSKTT